MEERTAKFGENIIHFVKEIKKNRLNEPLLVQLIRSGTSVGANYCEAIGGSSQKDFKNKIYICKKEIQETKHWLRMIATMNPEVKEKSRELWKEAQELTLIFTKALSTMKTKKN
ncbi:MAG: four helix bundle protein [Candidatus Bathyarchaeia archaeon]